jgi:hypothetical protein
MFGQHVNAEFFSSFCEAEEGVQSEHISEYATPLVVMHQFEKLLGELFAGLVELLISRALVKIVHSCVLVVQSFGKDPTPEPFGCKHGLHKGLELDIAMIHGFGYGTP